MKQITPEEFKEHFEELPHYPTLIRVDIGGPVYGSWCCVYFYVDDRTTAYIGGLRTSIMHRRNGKATKIIKDSEELMKKIGFEWSCLKVIKESWMHSWYARLGYEDFQDENEHVWMKKQLKNNENN